jgi:hypothetical protein
MFKFNILKVYLVTFEKSFPTPYQASQSSICQLIQIVRKKTLQCINFRILEKSKISTNLSYDSLLKLVSCDVSRPKQKHELKLTLESLIMNQILK